MRGHIALPLAAAGILLLGAPAWSWRSLRHRTRQTKSTNTSTVVTTQTQAAQTLDLIEGEDWSRLPGAIKTDSAVHIDPVGRAIVNQDGSENQTNPPVNPVGPSVRLGDNFTISAILKPEIKQGGSVHLYGELPVIYDEWRFERKGIRFTIQNNTLTVELWDGRHRDPVEKRSFIDVFDSTLVLSVEKKGSSIIVMSNGTVLQTVPDHRIFSDKILWFGADARVGTPGWDLTTLKVEGDGVVFNAPANIVARDNPESLRNLASLRSRPLYIGGALALNPLMSDAKYRTLALGEFNMMTTENELKPQFVHPLPDVYVFNDADTIVDTATAHGMVVHGHTLVFGEANARWMTTAPKDQRKQIMIDHITNVMTHFKDRIAEWDVVNEPMSDYEYDREGNPTLRNHIWYQAMGESYIDEAFKAARSADPDAKLFINEFGLEEDGERWDAFIQLLNRLQSRGVPVDGVGFQAHVYDLSTDKINGDVLRKHMQQLASMGLLSRVSELDVSGVRESEQTQQYAEVLKACQAEPTCTSFSTWGVTDRYGSTTEINSYPPEYGDNLIWDDNYQAKPIYKALQDTLRLP